MNTILKWFGIILLVLVVVGLIIPNDVNVRRSIEINATPEQIHYYVDNLEQWPKWGPWATMDPTMKTTIGEIKSGVGASQSWKGEGGNGSLKITSSSPEKGVAYEAKGYQASKRIIDNYIKAFIGSRLYNDDAFFPVFHELDNVIKEAVKLMPKAIELEATGQFSEVVPQN